MLIDVWATVNPEGWELVIVGPSEGGHRAELEERVRQLDLQDVVSFAGPVADEEKWSEYQKADLFILPTYSENFGIVVAEALATGCPVLTTTGTPWQELKTHRCGWWVEPRPPSIAQALRDAVGRSDEQRRRMGERGRALVENKYSWTGVAKKMERVYRWIQGEGAPPNFVHLGP
jgi:glycosyltransferase involved in cell wall biosynthesis